MRIYISSKVKHAARWQALRDAGAAIISTWIDEAGPGASSDYHNLAHRCIEEARTADALILYCEPGEILKGALIEVGAALAWGRPVLCVGTCESLSPVLVKHCLWSFEESLESALERLGVTLETKA